MHPDDKVLIQPVNVGVARSFAVYQHAHADHRLRLLYRYGHRPKCERRRAHLAQWWKHRAGRAPLR
jgi:hypothetical protein